MFSVIEFCCCIFFQLVEIGYKGTIINAKEIEDSFHTFLLHLTFERKQILYPISYK